MHDGRKIWNCWLAISSRLRTCAMWDPRPLDLDLRTNHLTKKARNRQRKWAREDKDFTRIRTNLRFQELVRDR